MKIKLLTNIFEADRFGNLTLKVTQRPRRGVVIAWTTGTVIEVSDASGEKYISAGKAEKADEQAHETEVSNP